MSNRAAKTRGTITEITRRDVFDFITLGHIAWNGRANEVPGATWGAIIGRHRAIPGHAQPLRERKTARQAACSVFRRSPRPYLLSSGSRVRILPGAPIDQARAMFRS